MSSSSLEEVRITTGSKRVSGCERMRLRTSNPPTFGSLRSSRTTAGSRPSLNALRPPSPKRNSSACAPSRATVTSFAILAFLNERRMSSSSSGLSSTSSIDFADIGSLLGCLAGCEHFGEALGLDGRRIEMALRLVASHRAQRRALLGGFDRFGDDLEAEAMPERDDRLHDRRVAGIAEHACDERAVDLQ